MTAVIHEGDVCDTSRRVNEKPDRDLHEEANNTLAFAYANPAFSLSTNSINHKHKQDPNEFMGSNDFIAPTRNPPKTNSNRWDRGPGRNSETPAAERRSTSDCPSSHGSRNTTRPPAVGDLVAGITVGLTLIPQALAYSSIAGVPTEYGLYGSFMGCFIYIVFGSCKDVPFGPTAIMSLLTFQAIQGHGPEHAILLCFFTGVVQVLMGLFGLGFLIDFVSGPVSSGFTSAAALIIITSQVRDVLGIQASGNTFVNTWRSIFFDIHNTQVWDAVMGLSCIVILLIMRMIGAQKIGPKGDDAQPNTCQKIVNKSLWLVGTARNAILVVSSGVPPFGFESEKNGTVVSFSFLEMMDNLGAGIIILPLIGLLENIAICKAFANGKPVDATQELIAIGLCNFVTSFAQGFPGSGALARSAVNNSSGVRTTLGGLYTGLLVILSLLFFTPYFYYIPKAALAGIIIAAVIFMVEVKVVKPMWRSKIVWWYRVPPSYPDRCLIFPSVDYVRNLVTKQSLRQGIPVVIDCTHIYGADYTAATVVDTLTQDFAARDQPLMFYNLKPSVCSVFEGLSPKDFIVFYNEEDIDNLLKNWSHDRKETEVISV
ncbi:hypothetical protein NQ317_003640 [Molorchus minor]|uniref:Sodium-independent sulfate anion transporter n=1 Tax=Molorchus minor TaxID=1323400 RepID=A0ABQ9JFT9_9CUCU|nr:hypothetical protein NQ317_003640 [Molorchus minor]